MMAGSVQTLIERLLAEGLEHFNAHNHGRAVALWRQVVELDPDNQRALDCLSMAGAPSTPPPPGSSRPPPVGLRARVESLLAGGSYDEALAALLEAQGRVPDDPGIKIGIRMVKKRLLTQYLRQVGHRRRVLLRTEDVTTSVTERERELLGLIDGERTVAEILHACPLEDFEIYRLLSSLIDKGHLRRPRRNHATSPDLPHLRKDLPREQEWGSRDTEPPNAPD